MTSRRFPPSDPRPRQPFGRSNRASTPPTRRRSRSPRKLIRNVVFGIGMALVAFVVAATEGQGWLGSGADADAQHTTATSPATTPTATRSLPLCPPKLRRGGGGVTCITDGDSGVADGEPWRLTTRSGGVDAPEVGRPECAAERTAGDRATRRLQALMSSGYTMSGGGTDKYGRRLVTVTLADGRDAGRVLIDEGLAQPWPNSSNPWC